MREVPSRRKRLAPYAAAFSAMIAIYVTVELATGQLMLSAACAMVAALLAYIVARLIQLRGRITLALAVIGLPLLCSLIFAGHQSLQPFIERQQTIRLLSEAGITHFSRKPDQFGEWKRDQHGNMLPVWLANAIGPDCLSEVRSVHADLASLQSIPFERLKLGDNALMQLSRQSDEPKVDKALIRWINRLDLRRLELSLNEFSQEDADALERLEMPYVVSVTTNLQAGDLSSLSGARSVTVRGDSLTPKQARELAKLPNAYLYLRCRSVSVESIRELSSDHSSLVMHLIGTQLDEEQWIELARTRLRYLTLDSVALRSLPSDFNDDQPLDRELSLRIERVPLSEDEAVRLLKLFGCEEFEAVYTGLPDVGPSMWAAKNLQRVRTLETGGGWKETNRPHDFRDH